MTASAMRTGLWQALLCYGIWGMFPLFWYPLNQAAMPAGQILAQRIVWSAVFSGALLLYFRQGRELLDVLSKPKTLAAFMLSALLVSGNWLIYLWAITHHRVVDASLGYFINPLFNVLLGVAVLKERLNGTQAAAVLLAAAGIVWLGVLGGQMPWVALMLAFSFGVYALVRKLVPIAPLAGLTLETLLMLPFALAYLAWAHAYGGLVFAGLTPLQQGVLLASGAATTIPLLLFASAAQRIPLSLLGVLQNLSPFCQLLLGLWFGEQLGGARLGGYLLVWCGVAVFLIAAWRQNRQAA